jgi:hypothetical protein
MLFVIILGVVLPIVTLIIGAQWGRAYERSLWQDQLVRRSIRLAEAERAEDEPSSSSDRVRGPLPPTT